MGSDSQRKDQRLSVKCMLCHVQHAESLPLYEACFLRFIPSVDFPRELTSSCPTQMPVLLPERSAVTRRCPPINLELN